MSTTDEHLDALRLLTLHACERMREHATRTEIDHVCSELEARFTAIGTRVPRGERVPIDELTQMNEHMRGVVAALPFELQDFPRKYDPRTKPVFRWSEVATVFAYRLESLRYDVLMTENTHACDCLVLVALGKTDREPRSPSLRGIDWDYGDAYACDDCGTRWWHDTIDTESEHSESWEPAPPSWEPTKAPA